MKPITPIEVLSWFQQHREPWPSDNDCEAIAEMLNRIGLKPWTQEEADAATHAHMGDRPIQRSAQTLDQTWWDFKATAKAAQTLLQAIPAIKEFSEKIDWADETKDFSNNINTLEMALRNALPYINSPFGGRSKKRSSKPFKRWHAISLGVMPIIARAMINAGNSDVSRSKNSVVILILRRALIRTGAPASLSSDTIAKYVDRWAGWQGMTTNEVAELCSL